MICPSAVAAVHSANQTFGVSLLGGAAPEPFWLEDEFFTVQASSLVERSLALWEQRFFARVGFWRSGWFQLAVPGRVFVEMQADGQPRAHQQADGQGGRGGVTAEQADILVRERLNQAFSSVFGKLIESSERAAAAAERQANVVKNDNLVKGLKCDQWKPQTREEELKTWREWYFGFTNFISSHDPEYEAELSGLDLEKEATHDLMPAEQVARSQRLFGLLCFLLRGRPLMLIRACDKTKAGYEVIRILKNEMEPREKARTLALLRQLASWRFDERATMHEQLVRYEEALRTYETSSGKPFPEDVVLAPLVTGLKEPLRSQVQLKMSNDTKYADVREWILQYESLTTPWGFTVPSKGSPSTQDGPQPMDVDIIKGKGKDKGKKGKTRARRARTAKAKARMEKGDREMAKVAGTMGAPSPGTTRVGAAMRGAAPADGSRPADGAMAKDPGKARERAKAWIWKGPRRLQSLWPEGPLEVGVPHEGQGQRKGEPGGDATTPELYGIYLDERFYHFAFCLAVPRDHQLSGGFSVRDPSRVSGHPGV